MPPISCFLRILPFSAGSTLQTRWVPQTLTDHHHLERVAAVEFVDDATLPKTNPQGIEVSRRHVIHHHACPAWMRFRFLALLENRARNTGTERRARCKRRRIHPRDRLYTIEHRI